MLEAGMKAPEFTLADKDGNSVSLQDFRGKKVVLYFYPKDSTPGCTRQACAFSSASARTARHPTRNLPRKTASPSFSSPTRS